MAAGRANPHNVALREWAAADFLDIDQIGLAELTRNVVVLAIGFAALGYLVLGAGRLTVRGRV